MLQLCKTMTIEQAKNKIITYNNFTKQEIEACFQEIKLLIQAGFMESSDNYIKRFNLKEIIKCAGDVLIFAGDDFVYRHSRHLFQRHRGYIAEKALRLNGCGDLIIRYHSTRAQHENICVVIFQFLTECQGKIKQKPF